MAATPATRRLELLRIRLDRADTPGCTTQAYSVWVQKSMYGRTYMGNERTTFVINADGTIKDVFRKVKPAEHDELVLGALASA